VVPQNLSGYRIRVAGDDAMVGFHGSFWVDSENLDLKRLEVHADDIPPRLRLVSASTAVEYQRVQIGTGEFLLPSLSEMEIVDLTGSLNRNRTRFEACRQYTGESTISFDDPALDEQKPKEIRTLDAPGGLGLDIALETAIRGSGAAVGDPVKAVLKNDIKLPDGTKVAKGALVHGRVTFLRSSNAGRASGFTIGLELHEIESDSLRMRISAMLEHMPSASRTLTPSTRYYVYPPEMAAETTAPGSFFYAQGYTLVLDRGLRMYWRTKAIETEGSR
jgi:hypothetical protein